MLRKEIFRHTIECIRVNTPTFDAINVNAIRIYVDSLSNGRRLEEKQEIGFLLRRRDGCYKRKDVYGCKYEAGNKLVKWWSKSREVKSAEADKEKEKG